MSQIIRAECDRCGPQDLRPTALHLTVFSHGEGHHYAFFCPGCTEEVVHPADLDVCLLLRGAGVAASEVIVPLEVLEHPPASIPPISPDDVMEFVVRLRGLGRSIDDEQLC